ncbi:XRE family transcriptional regulator [bacterium]|nr:XRE family transcriptional regulator [bacterium]
MTLVRSRLTTLSFSQKDLAQAAQVADSYVSQLLTRKRPPPAPNRTDIYPKMEAFLQLEQGALGRLAEIERIEELKNKLRQTPEPLFQGFRDLILGKCVDYKRDDVRVIFERHPFGTLERLIARKLLDVVQGIARKELDSENWIRLAARVGSRTHEQMRVMILTFLDAEISDISREDCVAFMDPLVQTWDIDLDSFRFDVTLNPQLVADSQRRFEFVETAPVDDGDDERTGFTEFLEDKRLSGDITEKEARLLRLGQFDGKRPTKLYYHRALQNLRDPLHFQED